MTGIGDLVQWLMACGVNSISIEATTGGWWLDIEDPYAASVEFNQGVFSLHFGKEDRYGSRPQDSYASLRDLKTRMSNLLGFDFDADGNLLYVDQDPSKGPPRVKVPAK